MANWEVYGAINTSGTELDWIPTPAHEVLEQLNNMPGTVYGIHWTFPRDTGLDSNILLTNNEGFRTVFYGRQAVKNLKQQLTTILE